MDAKVKGCAVHVGPSVLIVDGLIHDTKATDAFQNDAKTIATFLENTIPHQTLRRLIALGAIDIIDGLFSEYRISKDTHYEIMKEFRKIVEK